MRAGALHLEVVRQQDWRGSLTTAGALAHERTLPVVASLASVVPSGRLQRGSTVSVHGVGATSLTLALVGEMVRDGGFLGVIAPESFNLAACLDFEIPLRRVVQFCLGEGEHYSQAVASVIEGFDAVMIADGRRISASVARQLTARNRERGSVLLRVGGPSWPDAADLRFDVVSPEWSGLGQGHGHLRARRVSVQIAGRRYHGKARGHTFLLPAVGGGVEPAPKKLERFAGADIDALLDVVDSTSEMTPPEEAATEAGSGLDAIA